MKRLLPTIILVVVCIGVYWYAKSNDFFRTTEPVKTLDTIQNTDVTELEITTDDAIIHLKQDGENWDMSEPAAYPLQSSSVDSWLNTFSGLTYDDIIEANPTDLAEFGLDAPKQKFQVTLKDGTAKTLLIGSAMAVSSDVYVKWEDSSTVYSMPSSSLTDLSKKPFDFISTSAVPLNYANVKNIKYTWQGAAWELDKAEADKSVYETTWKMDGNDRTSDQGTAILDKITGLTTSVLPKAIKDVDLTAPDFTLVDTETDASGKDVVTTYIGKIVDQDVWVAKQGGDWAYSIPLTSAQDLATANVPPATASPTPAS